MTLLEKLNLEPGAVATGDDRVSILSEMSSRHVLHYRGLVAATINLPSSLTNAEFLAACEEWLSKN